MNLHVYHSSWNGFLSTIHEFDYVSSYMIYYGLPGACSEIRPIYVHSSQPPTQPGLRLPRNWVIV